MINVQIESKQREFFGLLCLHSFYSDNVTRDLEFEPTLETASQLKNYGLVFKAIPFGFLVLYNPDNSIEKLREMPKGMRFSFRIKNTNPNFMNFSHIPFWPEGEVFHYSNAKINRQDLPFNPTKDIYYYFRNLRLGDVRKNVLNLPEHPLVSLRSKKFNMQVGGKDEDGVNYNSIRIVDEKGEEKDSSGVPYRKRYRDSNRDHFRRHLDHEAMKMKAQGLSPEEIAKRIGEVGDKLEQDMMATKYANHVIDLRHAAYGKYTIEWGGKGKGDVYITDNAAERLFGMLDVFVDGDEDALLNRSAANDSEVVKAQMFVIKYDARQTYWRYHFLNYTNSIVSPLSIRDERNDLSFTEPQSGILEQLGTPTMISESVQPIALKERPDHVLYLERANGKRSMKDVRLPTPGPDMVKPVKVADIGYKMYSDVFVYL
jgi:hypothetical protein